MKGWSGWADSNRRPPAPEAGALTGLRYTPTRGHGPTSGRRPTAASWGPPETPESPRGPPDVRKMVGVTGFEPATPSTPRRCASGLRHTPTGDGELYRIRTCDLLLRRQALYPAELIAHALLRATVRDRRATRELDLEVALLVTVLAQALLALVGVDLMPLSLPSTRHPFPLLLDCPRLRLERAVPWMV